MKAHNPIDDMFQQHFAESAIPMNNQEALWQRISNKKDNKNRGFLWLSTLGLIFCAAAGFGIINLNSSVDQNLTNNANINTVINESPSQIENNQIIFIESEEKADEKINDLKNEKNEIQGEILISNSKEQNFDNGTIIQSSRITQEEATFKKTDEINDFNSDLLSRNEAEKKINTVIENKSTSTDLALLDLEIKDVNLFNNIPPIFNQTDSWSRCEVETPGHFFVDIYGQAGLPLDKIDFSQSGSDQNAYRDLWDARFDPKASWHGGAQIGYEFRKGLRVSAGVEYQEIVTQYSDNQRITETIRVWDPQAYYTIDMNGDRVWVGDTVTAINIYDRKFVRKNTHTLLHIPLQVSYDIYKKPSFHVAIDVAAALNVSKTYEGQYIRSDQTLIMIDSNSQDNYTSKDIGVSFSAGLHLGYYLNDNWELYASPRFRYNPNSYLLDTETLKITRNMVGLRGGVRYHF